MAVDKCKDHFAALFPFHEVLKAPGTVLIAHAVEHKQQTFGRVWEPNLLLQGPLILWCQLSVTCSDPYFSLMISEVWAIALGDPQWCFRGKLPLRLKEIPMQVSQLHTKWVCSLHWQGSRETCMSNYSFRHQSVLPCYPCAAELMSHRGGTTMGKNPRK